MARVRVGQHLCVNLSRRSLCDNCWIDVCLHDRKEIVDYCEDFKPLFPIYRRCRECGEIYELFSNFKSFDPELCPRCNSLHFSVLVMSFPGGNNSFQRLK